MKHRPKRRWYAPWRSGCTCGGQVQPCEVIRERRAQAARDRWVILVRASQRGEYPSDRRPVE